MIDPAAEFSQMIIFIDSIQVTKLRQCIINSLKRRLLEELELGHRRRSNSAQEKYSISEVLPVNLRFGILVETIELTFRVESVAEPISSAPCTT